MLLLLSSLAAAGTTVENVRIWSENDKTRVVLDLSQPVEHNIFTLRGPDRLVVDLKDSRLGRELTRMPRGAGAIRSIRSAVRANGQLRVVFDLNAAVRSRTFTAGPNATNEPRMALATTYFEDGARVVASPTKVSGDWRKFMPGVEPGQPIASPYNPVCSG